GESQVIAGDYDYNIRRWKTTDGQQQGPTVQANSTIRSIVVSQDGRWMVSGDDAKKTIVWNAATLQRVHEFTEHSDRVSGVDISSDCTKYASADRSNDHNNVRIFSITSGIQLLPSLRHPCATGIKFSPDGSRFATTSDTHGLRVYSTHNGDILFDSGQMGSSSAWPVAPLVWYSDQQLFVGSIGKLTCFDLSKSSHSAWFIHGNQSRSHIASNGRFIAYGTGSSVPLWDCVSHKQIGGMITHSSSTSCVALSPSGEYLACG
ncbi:hypothetical protein M404DRAFT_49903, partial [Pisolithus tinctorius Marx 270]